MSRLAILCMTFVVLASLVFAPVVVNAQVTGKIVVVSVPDRLKGNKEATTGLKTVPVGTRIVLVPVAWSGTGQKYADTLLTVTSATWTLTGPTGSTATIQDTTAGLNGLVESFIPDKVGQYTVSMTATTAKGTAAQVSITVTAAKFVGAGWSLTYPSYGVPNSCGCHGTNPAVFTEWQNTKHAKAVKRRFDNLDDNDVPGTAAGHFGDNCMPCHSAGGNKASAFSSDPNGGFKEYATNLGFHVPTNRTGAFDSIMTIANSGANSTTDSLKTLMALTGIQCENCHGPAGEHVKGYPTSGNTKLDKTFSSDVCAPCHFSSDRHPKGYSWAASAHANSLAEGIQAEYTDRPGCTRCHTGQGYVDQTINGNAEPVVATGMKVYANPQPISCQACHDPHEANNPAQLRRASIADACTGCHTTRFSGYTGLHHAHQGQMLVGADGVPMSASVPLSGVADVSGWELPGYTYTNSSHSAISERCVVCHMAQTPTYDPTFTKPDTLLNKIGGHTFKVAWDVDSVTTILNDVGCRECHGSVAIEFVELSQQKIKSLLTQLAAVLPKRDSANTIPVFPQDGTRYKAWTGAPSALKLKLTQIEIAAAYNYAFVNNDGSFGVHNHDYAAQLLTSSIEQLKLGQGAASIVSVRDVPKDQGHQVQVLWNKFPAEKFSYNPAVKYGVWRLDPNLKLNPMGKASSVRNVLLKGTPGASYVVGNYVWTFVADVPAGTQDSLYACIVPTLYDSTVAAGMKYSTFYVAGYAANSAAVYSSAPDSGYSVDNLRPITPQGLIASRVSNGAKLVWNAPTDPDIDYYVVYRSMTPNFDPSGVTPIADKVKGTEYVDQSVSTGNTYFYAIQAVDLSGLKSDYSAQTSVQTGVVEQGGIPTEFALGQNYPNPFNPSTDIRFALPNEEQVRITIYSVSGIELKTLVNARMSAGNYSVRWDGTNSTGEHVSSGVYLYRIQAGSFTAVKKMVMLK